MPHQLADGPHLLDLAQLALEVLQREAVLHEPLCGALGLVRVDGLLNALDEADHVAHPEDALREAIGMKWLEAVGSLPGPEEGDRQAGGRTDAERRAAARVAVHLGQHEAGDGQLGVERLGHAHRLLPGHGIDDEECLRRRDGSGDPHQLVHHRVVDVETARRIQDHHVHAALTRHLEAGSCDLERRRADRPGMDLDADLVAKLDQLVHGSGPVDVGRHEQGSLSVPPEAHRELRGRGRLSGALEADHHQDGGASLECEAMPLAAEHRDELIVDDLDDLLSRVDAVEDVRAERALADGRHEVLDDAEVDVRLEQCQADLAQGGVEIGLGDAGLASQALRDVGEARGQRFEHEVTDTGIRVAVARAANGCPF